MTIIKLIQNRKYWAGVDRPWYASQNAVSEKLQGKGFRNIVFHARSEPLPANVNPKTCHIWTDEWDEWISAEYYGPSGEGELPATPAWILHSIEPASSVPVKIIDGPPKEDVPQETEKTVKVVATVVGVLAVILLLGRRR